MVFVEFKSVWLNNYWQIPRITIAVYAIYARTITSYGLSLAGKQTKCSVVPLELGRDIFLLALHPCLRAYPKYGNYSYAKAAVASY